jgi:3-isopropylmalate dehydrogenase
MTIKKKLLLLPGDGIGPEVIATARKVVDWFVAEWSSPVEVREALIGGASIERTGVPMTADVFYTARSSDAILLGCVGGPKWDFNERHLRPGHGLLTLRKELQLFANLRPVKAYPALSSQSTLKPRVIEGVDLLIVRELTGGIYFGEPRGIEVLPNGERRGFNTQTYSTHEIERIARSAFKLARSRKGRMCSVDKANVLETSEVWRDTVTAIGRHEFPDVELSHMFVDNCAMQLIRWPGQFDVILTDNIFGDILSDCAAMISGSLGLLPSASLGLPPEGGLPQGLYEPVHGSAPDIAGQGISNPYGALLSLEMLLRHSFGMEREAQSLGTAIEQCLQDGVLTRDLQQGHGACFRTEAVGDAVVEALARGS